MISSLNKTKAKLLFFIFSIPTFISQNVDSLEKVIPSLTGIEKGRAYYQTVYPLIFTDVQKSVRNAYYAWEIFKKHKADSLEIASLLNDLSMAYFQLANHDSSIILNKIAYGIRLRRGKWRDAGASASKIGVNFNQLHNTKEGLKWNLIAADLFRKANAKVELAKTLNNIGRAYFLNEQYSDALKIYYQGAKESLELGDTVGFVNVRGNIAVVYEKIGNHDSVLIINQSLLNLVKKHNYVHYLGHFYHNLGVHENSLGNYKRALEYYINAVEWYEKFKDIDGLAGVYTNLGNVYLKLNDKKNALINYQKGFEYSKMSGSWRWLKHAYNGLAEFYQQDGNFQKANEYLKLSYLYKDSIFDDEKQKTLLRLQAEYDLKEKENQILERDLNLKQKEADIQVRNRNIIILLAIVFFFILGIIILLLKRKSEKQKHYIEVQNRLNSERSRIARDLHDNLGAELTLANNLSDKYAYLTSNPEERLKWNEMGEQIRRANLTMRDTIWAIHENEISLNNLIRRIKDYALRMAEIKDMSIQTDGFEQIPDMKINPEKALHLFRACQEIIQNSVKHSKGNIIKLIWTNNYFQISDNGIGFDPQNTNASEGYGLKNIKKRLQEAGVDFDLKTGSEGTVYELKIA
jgi:signal transduction histidine kinase